MKKKMIIPMLSLLLFLQSITALSGVAEDSHWIDSMPSYELTTTTLPDGTAGVTLRQGLDGAVIVTDADGLDPSLFPGCIIYEETAAEWTAALPDTQTDDRYFVVDTRPTKTRDEEGYLQDPFGGTALRRIDLTEPGIRSIHYISRSADGTAEWAGGFIGILPTGDSVRETVDISACAGYDDAIARLAGLTGAAQLDAARAAAEALRAETSSLCDLVFPTITVTVDEADLSYTATDLWDSVGDVDGLDGPDARDAADILNASVNYAVHGNYELDGTMQDRADVNADGAINAVDASIILIYSTARAVSEETLSIRDFL